MRYKQHPPIRPFALAATAALIATTVALALGAGIGLAADFQEAKGNVCEGNFVPPTWCNWTAVTGEDNVALGKEMMPALTSGFNNVALNFGALKANTAGGENVAIGVHALGSNTVGSHNLASGSDALFSNTTGSFNLASGTLALANNTAGHDNLAFGFKALFFNTTGFNNIASGTTAMYSNTTGSNNTASGFQALISNTTGSSNVALGSGAGENLTTGSNNIDISNTGLPGEANTTRIGTAQTKAFMAGVTTPVVGCTVQVTAAGQLGCNSAASAAGSTAIATFASFGNVPSGKCLKYTELAGQGQGPCPTSGTIGYSNSNFLAGPTPANNATVSNLYADSNVTLISGDTVTVEVIDNTAVALLLSCTVVFGSKSCANPGSAPVAAAGDNIEVRVTAAPSNGSGNNKQWRVRFRY
jgi:hypothetical protein